MLKEVVYRKSLLQTYTFKTGIYNQSSYYSDFLVAIYAFFFPCRNKTYRLFTILFNYSTLLCMGTKNNNVWEISV